MTQEVLKLALEALEELFDTNGYWWQEVDEQTLKKIEHSITAIKEALRENAMREVQRLGQEIEQEPVAWMWDVNNGAGYSSRGIGFYQTDIPFAKHTPLYTAPPQRTWVGLTDEEYDEIWRMDLNNKDIMDKTIAKLKEKNT